MEIRDSRNGEWSWVYNALIRDPHLSATEKVVYAALATYGALKEIRPSYETIAEGANISKRSAQMSVKKLIEMEYISVEVNAGRNHTNIYYLLKKPKGCKLCALSEKVQKTTIKGAKDDIEKVQVV